MAAVTGRANLPTRAVAGNSIGRPATPAGRPSRSLNQGSGSICRPPPWRRGVVRPVRVSSDNGATWPSRWSAAPLVRGRTSEASPMGSTTSAAPSSGVTQMSDPSIGRRRFGHADRPSSATVLIPLLGSIGLGLAARVVVFLVKVERASTSWRSSTSSRPRISDTDRSSASASSGRCPAGGSRGSPPTESTADVRIRHRGGGRFEVTAGGERYTVT